MATNAGQFSKSVVTTAGKEMIVQAQNGHTLTFTRVALGDGTLAEGEDMLALTAIKSEKLSANISSFLDKGNGQYRLKFNVNNTTLDTGFWHREIGVMAKIDDGDEELYAYSYAGAAANFLYDKTTPVQERFVNIDVLIGSATDVTVVIDGSVIYPTRAETAAMIQTHNDDAESHKDVYGRFIRQRQTDYELKDVVYLPSLGAKLYLECTTPGTTSASDLVITSPSVGDIVTDGTVIWTVRKVADTTEATTTTHGLMSASDKTKLNGIEANANNYSLPTASASVKGGIKVGTGLSMNGDTLNNAYSLPTASSSTLGGVKTGSNITNSGGTISLTKANVTSALGYTPPTTNTTYSTGTASYSGITKLYTGLGDNTDGTMTQKAIKAIVAKGYLTDSYYNANTGDWYRVYSDGWVEQGGKMGTATSITFLKPFSDANYYINFPYVVKTEGNGTVWTRLYDMSSTNFSYSADTTVRPPAGLKWYACGMGAQS